MKKLLAVTSVIAAMAVSAPAFANSAGVSASVAASAHLSTVQLSCLAAAVDAHEVSVTAARTAFSTSQMNALAVRSISLAAAFTISDNHDRQVAIEASVKAYTDAMKAARTTLHTAVRSAASVMVQARADCRVTVGTGNGTTMSGSAHGRWKTDTSKKSDNGLHLGQFKQL